MINAQHQKKRSGKSVDTDKQKRPNAQENIICRFHSLLLIENAKIKP